MKIKIFEADTMQEAVNELLDEGYFPATVKQIWDLKKSKQIEDKWYSTSTVYVKGEIRTATVAELRNLKKIYDDKGRVLFVDYISYGLYGINNLFNNGRFVGVAPEAQASDLCFCKKPCDCEALMEKLRKDIPDIERIIKTAVRIRAEKIFDEIFEESRAWHFDHYAMCAGHEGGINNCCMLEDIEKIKKKWVKE